MRRSPAHLAALNPVGMLIARWVECVDMQVSSPERSITLRTQAQNRQALVHVNHRLPSYITVPLPNVSRAACSCTVQHLFSPKKQDIFA